MSPDAAATFWNMSLVLENVSFVDIETKKHGTRLSCLSNMALV